MSSGVPEVEPHFSIKMATLDFKTAREFQSAVGGLGYREVQSYAKRLNLAPRNVKKEVLVEKINKHLLSLEPRGGKGPSGPSRIKEPTGVAKSVSKPKSPIKKLKGKKSPSQDSLSRNSLSKGVARPAKSTPRSKSVIKKPAEEKKSLLTPFAVILNLVFADGDQVKLREYLMRVKPTTADLRVAVGELNVTDFSWYLPHVLEVLENFYPKLPIHINDELARALFAASLVTDDTMVFKLALRVASVHLSASTLFWEYIIPKAMEMDAMRSFETAIRMGVFGMDMYRGEAGHARAMHMIVRAMKTAQADKENLRFFLLLLEEMILNEEINYYTLEDLNQITPNFL